MCVSICMNYLSRLRFLRNDDSYGKYCDSCLASLCLGTGNIFLTESPQIFDKLWIISSTHTLSTLSKLFNTHFSQCHALTPHHFLLHIPCPNYHQATHSFTPIISKFSSKLSEFLFKIHMFMSSYRLFWTSSHTIFKYSYEFLWQHKFCCALK